MINLFKKAFNHLNRPTEKQTEESKEKLYKVLSGFINPDKTHTDFSVLYGCSIDEGVGRYFVSSYLVGFDYDEGWILVAIFCKDTLKIGECMVFHPLGKPKVTISPNGTLIIADSSLKCPIEVIIPIETPRNAAKRQLLPIEQSEKLLLLRKLIKDKYRRRKKRTLDN